MLSEQQKETLVSIAEKIDDIIAKHVENFNQPDAIEALTLDVYTVFFELVTIQSLKSI